MALGFEFSADGLDATGVLGNDLSVALERAPLRGDVFATLLRQLVRSIRGDPREDVGCDRAGEIGLVLLRERGSEFVDGGQFALRHLFHQRINLERSGDNKTAFAVLRKLAVAAVAVLRQIFGIVEFSIPINAHSLKCDREITPSEAV